MKSCFLVVDDDQMFTFCRSSVVGDHVSGKAGEGAADSDDDVSLCGPLLQLLQFLWAKTVIHHLYTVFLVVEPSSVNFIDVCPRHACFLSKAIVVLSHPVSNAFAIVHSNKSMMCLCWLKIKTINLLLLLVL